MSASIEKSFPPNDKKPPQDAGPFPGPAAASFLFVPLMLLDYVDESGLSVREEVYSFGERGDNHCLKEDFMIGNPSLLDGVKSHVVHGFSPSIRASQNSLESFTWGLYPFFLTSSMKLWIASSFFPTARRAKT